MSTKGKHTMKWASATVLILLLSGCVTHRAVNFYRDGTPPEQVKADKDACRYEAMKATASAPSGTSLWGTRLDLINECMKLKGYRPAEQ
jgi:hypothetical protein